VSEVLLEEDFEATWDIKRPWNERKKGEVSKKSLTAAMLIGGSVTCTVSHLSCTRMMDRGRISSPFRQPLRPSFSSVVSILKIFLSPYE
jgi:hypothetical protein